MKNTQNPFGKMAHTSPGQTPMGFYYGSAIRNKFATVKENAKPMSKKDKKITLA